MAESGPVSVEIENATKEEIKRPTRERKKVQPLVQQTVVSKTEFKITEGKGTELKQIPNVSHQIDRLRSNDQVLIAAHRMAFGRLGKSTNRKSNLRKFSGVNGETEAMVKQRVSRLKPFKLLKEVVQLFDCKSSGSSMEEYANSLVKFLLKPEASGNVIKTGSKEKSKSKGKGKSKKAKKASDGPKRPTTAFFFFLKEARELVKKKHPEYGVTEIAQKCSSKWKKMTAEEKKPFEKLARKDKERYESEKKSRSSGEKNKSKRSPSPSSSSSSSESGSDSSSDSEVEEKKASKGKSKRKEKAKKSKKEEK